ncbi:hypothetical protein [Thermococcus sp. 9N3]|uniref:hypothetical protein n=1 Tax=Thermococcus sp. 9N3 TaxID=163002 RepID=UPI0014322AC4|nr:hypothetical protein [Thermococcus sp. 9N3]
MVAMGLIQFRRLWGEKVIVERKNRDVVVGTLSGEDGMFIYLEDGQLIRENQTIEVPTAVISKKSISMLQVKKNE